MHPVEDFVNFGACEVVRPHVPHYQVVVCAVGDEGLTGCHQARCNCSCVLDHLFAVNAEFWCGHLLELDGERADLMVVWATLEHRENGKVDLVSEFLLAEDNA